MPGQLGPRGTTGTQGESGIDGDKGPIGQTVSIFDLKKISLILIIHIIVYRPLTP